MRVVSLALAVTGVAMTLLPAVRAGLRVAPLLVTPRMRQSAAEAALEAAYRAGTAARKLVVRRA